MKDKIIFRLDNNQFYSLEQTMTKRIVNLKEVKINKIPNTNKYFEGLINYHGETISLYNLNKYLGIDENFNKNHLAIIINYNNQSIGFVVLNVEKFSKINEKDFFQYNSLNKKINHLFYENIENSNELIMDISLELMFN